MGGVCTSPPPKLRETGGGPPGGPRGPDGDRGEDGRARGPPRGQGGTTPHTTRRLGSGTSVEALGTQGPLGGRMDDNLQRNYFFNPVLHLIKCHIHFPGPFCLTVVVMMPSASELSVFIGVGGWGKPSYLRLMQMDTAVFPLLKSTPTFDLAEEATTCLIIMNYVWIGAFGGVERFGAY